MGLLTDDGANGHQQADEASMLRVMASPAKLVSRKISGSDAAVMGETAPQTAPRR